MDNVYIVMSSNCEAYEDYHESIDSVWSTYAAALNHIEDELGMTQVSHRNPSKPWSRDRWKVDIPEYPCKEDFEDDPEGWQDCHDEYGNLIPYWVYSKDAWIVEMPVNRCTN